MNKFRLWFYRSLILICAVSPIVLGWYFYIYLVQSKQQAEREVCQANLVSIDKAVQEFILGENLCCLSITPFAGIEVEREGVYNNAERIIEHDISLYNIVDENKKERIKLRFYSRLEFLDSIPECPSGGKYFFLDQEGFLGQTVYCTLDQTDPEYHFYPEGASKVVNGKLVGPATKGQY